MNASSVGPSGVSRTVPPRGRNPRGHGNRLRLDLLHAAAELVEEAGDGRQLTMRAVAARARVAATSVYLHFSDIAAIKHALAQEAFVAFAAERDAAAAGVDDPFEVLTRRCRAWAHYGITHPGRYRLLFGPDLAMLNPARDAGAPSDEALEELARSIHACRVPRRGRTTAASRRTALLLWAAMHGLVSLRIDRAGVGWPPLDEQIDLLLDRLIQHRAPRNGSTNS